MVVSSYWRSILFGIENLLIAFLNMVTHFSEKENSVIWTNPIKS